MSAELGDPLVALEPPIEPPSVVVRSPFFPRSSAPELGPAPDLGSYFTEEPLRSARSALDAGRPEEALRLIGAPRRGELPALFLRAEALRRAGRLPEAARAFRELAGSYESLADRCLVLAGQAYEATQSWAAAAEVYGSVHQQSLLHREARRGLARALKRRGDLRGALEALLPQADRPAPAWGADTAGDDLFAVAELQQALGDAAAKATYLRVWSEHPHCSAASAALERARALNASPSADQRIVRAELLMERHRSQQAIDLLAPLLAEPPKELAAASLCRARFVVGKAHRKLRQHEKALAQLNEVVERCARDEVWARAAYVAGTSGAILEPARGLPYYQRLAQERADHPFADDALFYSAELMVRQGRAAEANHLLRRLVKVYPTGDFRAEALFKIFWLERAAGQGAKALETLKLIVRDYPGEAEGAALERARYWQARTLLDLQRRDEAIAAFERLMRERPASFYAVLSRWRLGALAPDKLDGPAPEAQSASIAAEAPPFSAGLAQDRHLVAAVELARLGMQEQAVQELLAVSRATWRNEQPPAALRWLATLLSDMGELRLAQVIARSELREDLVAAPSAGTLAVWQAAYPLAFRDTLERHAREAGVEPDLLQALIREESSLDPYVHSWAGAIGLCQLMPPTAREVARALRIPGRLTPGRLHDPDLNLRLGAHYLAKLLRGFEGNGALALASYNAGGGAVRRWLGERPGLEIDEFVEEIPVTETRNYVKRVLRSYAVYQLLYGRPPTQPALGQALAARKEG